MHKNKQTENIQILPGTPEWESICEQCGLCCLLKVVHMGRVYMTNVRCVQLDQKTRKCHCYNANYNKRDGNTSCGLSCAELDGSPVTPHTLKNEYPVPGFCPYVKKFRGNNDLKRPDVDFNNTISETEMPSGAKLSDYIIPGTSKFFQYNPAVNKLLKDSFTK